MNKYLRALIVIPTGMVKMGLIKLGHGRHFTGPAVCQLSPLSELTFDRGGELRIGRGFKMRDGAKLRVRRGAVCSMGRNVSMGSGNVINCQQSIKLGDNVILSPNVQIYDHDHDYACEGGVAAMKYITAPVEIGSNVWIGANCVILRGTKIGSNCVIGANTVVSGEIPDNAVVYQQRENRIKIREIKE